MTPDDTQARIGRITASCMADVMALNEPGIFQSGPRKGLPKPLYQEARVAYTRQLATERLTRCAKAGVKVAPLEWGHQYEPLAKATYEAVRGVLVRDSGFRVHPDYPFVGASPDFLCDPDGGGEIKCPFNQEVHFETLEDGLPSEHVAQIQGGLWVTGRQWWDFISYHPDFPPTLRLYVQRVPRDNAYIQRLAAACLSLEHEVCALVERHLRRIAA